MTGEFRAGHGRLRSRTGREDQADATTGRECGVPVGVHSYGYHHEQPSSRKKGGGGVLDEKRESEGVVPSINLKGLVYNL